MVRPRIVATVTADAKTFPNRNAKIWHTKCLTTKLILLKNEKNQPYCRNASAFADGM